MLLFQIHIYNCCCFIAKSGPALFVTPWSKARQALLSMGFPQPRILEWVAISFSRGVFPTQRSNHISCIGRWILYCWTTRESPPPQMCTNYSPFVGKVMSLLFLFLFFFIYLFLSLLFNMLSRLIITFLPRSKYLLISWLQSPSAVILESPQKWSLTLFPHLFLMKWWDWMPWS